MFGGLEIKGGTKDESNSSKSNNGSVDAPPVAAAPSSFSFLNSTAQAAPPKEESATSTSTTASAFGFLSAPATTAIEGPVVESSSGFSFLSPPAAEPNKSVEAASTASAAGSSFGFLADGVGEGEGEGEEKAFGAAESSSSASGFSFLSSPAGVDVGANNANTAANAARSDLLSTLNHPLPAGAGVSWSAPPVRSAAVKKPIKKKTGKTRVGVAASSGVASSSAPPPLPAVRASSPRAAPDRPAARIPPSPGSPPLKVKAERAHTSAEEFIREKQRSAIAAAAERAVLRKSESLSVDDREADSAPSLPPSSPADETYRAAEAAAREAKRMHVPHSSAKSKFSLSGFFGRSKGGGERNDVGLGSHGGVVGRGGGGGGAHGNDDGHGAGDGGSTAAEREDAKLGAVDGGAVEFREASASERVDADEHERQMRQMEKEARDRREGERQQQQRREAERPAERRRTEAETNRRPEALRRSPRDELRLVLANFAAAAKSSAERVSRLRLRRDRLRDDLLAAEKGAGLAARQTSRAERLQARAVAEEDFEEADRLAEAIDAHAKEREGRMELCRKISQALERMEEEREEAARGVAQCFGGVWERLKELEAEQLARRKEDGTDVLDRFAATSKRLSAETDRLNNDLKHIERDEELVAEERKELEGQIADGTKEFEAKCTQAGEKLIEVNKRIEDLRRQLAEAESEAATLNTEISTHQASIATVRNKFSRQLGRLEKKQTSVKESRAEWESEKASLEKEKTAHEAVVEAHSEDLLNMDKLLEDIRSELSVAKTFEDIISHQFKDVGSEDGEGDISNLDNEVLKFEAAVDEANQNVLSAEAAIESLQQEVSSIDVRLPILEAEKKMAASKRDFKAAGRASKEIKDALARKEQCEAELAGDALARKEAAKEDLSKAVAVLDEKKSIAAEQGKELGTKQMAALKEKIRGLKSILKDFNADSDTVGVACVGIFVIETQINVLEAHGKALGERYGGWEATPETSDAAKVDTDAEQSAPASQSAVNDATEKEITTEILDQFTALKEETSRLEAAIDKAAEEEDYEAAAELEEQLESARAGIEALGISSEALEDALANGIASSTNDQGEQDSPESESTSPQQKSIEASATENDPTKADEAAPPSNEIEDEKKMSEERTATETADEPETVNSVDCGDVNQEE